MIKRFLKLEINGDFIIVFYKRKKLFKVSNNVHNAANLLKMCK